jgi:hypothetical protein
LKGKRLPPASAPTGARLRCCIFCVVYLSLATSTRNQQPLSYTELHHWICEG